MNKKETADFLGISEKTLERIVRRRELFPQSVKGRHGRMLVFEDAAVSAYKVKRGALVEGFENPVYVHSIESETALARGQNLLPADNRTDTGDKSKNPFITELADALVVALDRRSQSVSLTDKLTLSLSDAVNLSGLSKTFLQAAIKRGELKVFPGQRGSKNVRRSDLDKFIADL